MLYKKVRKVSEDESLVTSRQGCEFKFSKVELRRLVQNMGAENYAIELG